MTGEANKLTEQTDWLAALPPVIATAIKSLELRDPGKISFSDDQPANAANGQRPEVWDEFLTSSGAFEGKFARLLA